VNNGELNGKQVPILSELEDYVSGLEKFEGEFVPVYYSYGALDRALELSSLADKSYQFLKEFFKTDIEIATLVLNLGDWEKRNKEYPYGAVFAGRGCVHFPSDIDTPFIQAVMPLYDHCPQNLKASLTSLMGYEDKAFRHACQRLIDLLMVHEMTHAFADKERVLFGQNWFSEVFPQYTEYAFLKRHEDENSRDLRIFEIVLDIFYEGGKPLIKYRSLEDFETLYFGVGPLNYCWYQGKFVKGVIELYGKYGESFIDRVIETFKVTEDSLVRKFDASCEGFHKWFNEWKKESEQ